MKNNWQTKTLGEVCDFQRGLTYSKKDEVKKSSNIVLRATNINLPNNSLDFSELKYINDKINISENKKVSQGTIIICTASGSKSHLGKVALIDKDYGYAFGGFMGLLVPSKIIIPKFLWYNLISENYKNFINKLSDGVNINNLKFSNLKEFSLSVPSLPTQKQIVKILDEVFESISKSKENAEKNLKNAKELFESYLEEIFSNPKEDWEEKKLGEVCEMINRGISPKYTKSRGLCVLNQKCIRDHNINFELSRLHNEAVKKVNPERLIQRGDILVNSTGTGTLGRVAQVRDEPIRATVDSHVTIVRPIKDIFYEPFFGYGLIFLEKEISLRGNGCGGQTELSRNTLKEEFKLCFPKSLQEQKTIVQKLDLLSKEIKELESIYEQKVKDLEELKKSMLQKAFSGELTKE